jgi:tetratricopeptide (TPR) repeat protein
MQHEYMLGHLPTLLHPDPKSAVIVGLGAGLTLGGVTADEKLERIVLIEIEPAVAGGARIFSDLSDDALDDARLEIHFQDGRNFLLTTEETFDVITADPIHPWAQGAVYLYTREYYDMIAERLSDGGIMCQWLPLYELSEDNLRSVVASFAGSFEHVTIWQATSDVVLIGSDQPIRVDLTNLQRRLEQPAVARQLGRIGLNDPLSLLADFTMDDAAVRAFAKDAIINTDDNLYLEFSSPLTIGQPVMTPNTLLFDAQRQSASAVLGDVEPMFKDIESADEMLSKYAASKSAATMASLELDTARLQNRPDYYRVAAGTARKGLGVTPGYGPLRQLLATILTSEGMWRRQAGEIEQALQLFSEALRVDPGHPFANGRIAIELMNRGRSEEAIPFLRRALERRPYFPDVEANLGIVLANGGDHESALPHLETAARMRPDNAVIHEMHARTLRALGRDAEADAAIGRARALQRPD